MKFYPYEKGAGQKKAKMKGGTTSFEVVLTWELDVLDILMGGGGRKMFPSFKSGGRGGGRTV